MTDLFNPDNLAKWIPAIAREVAPYEHIVVEDADVAKQLLDSGQLRSDASGLEDDIKAKAEALAAESKEDVEEIASRLREDFEGIAAIWHAEHGRDPEVMARPAKAAPIATEPHEVKPLGEIKREAQAAKGNTPLTADPSPAPVRETGEVVPAEDDPAGANPDGELPAPDAAPEDKGKGAKPADK